MALGPGDPLPSNAEIKRELNLPDENFEVLTRIPPPEESARRGGLLTSIGEFFGVPTILWRTTLGSIIAVIFVIAGIDDRVHQAERIWFYANEHVGELISYQASHVPREPYRYTAFLPPQINVADQRAYPAGVPFQAPLSVSFDMPSGTVVLPVSGSWNPGAV
jgi:hypothetical protein